jgi:pyroglutamyl-peptidase
MPLLLPDKGNHVSKTVLLTGFEPFDGEKINPAWEAVKALDGVEIAPGYHIVSRQLPCVFQRSLKVLEQTLHSLRPSLVIAVGQAGGRLDISLERVAINLDDARIPDNAGQQPIDTAVIEHGPAAYFSTLPLKAMLLALRHNGIPASVSQTAGTFVCNHVFYGLMHVLRDYSSMVRAGFVHIPYLPQQAARFPGTPSMSAQQVTAALRQMVITALEVKEDVAVSAGALH